MLFPATLAFFLAATSPTLPACLLTGLEALLVFIDCDLRKSVLVGRYRVKKGVKGLTHFLSGQNTLEEVIYQTNVPDMDIILAGPVPPNPSELLDTLAFFLAATSPTLPACLLTGLDALLVFFLADEAFLAFSNDLSGDSSLL